MAKLLKFQINALISIANGCTHKARAKAQEELISRYPKICSTYPKLNQANLDAGYLKWNPALSGKPSEVFSLFTGYGWSKCADIGGLLLPNLSSEETVLHKKVQNEWDTLQTQYRALKEDLSSLCNQQTTETISVFIDYLKTCSISLGEEVPYSLEGIRDIPDSVFIPGLPGVYLK